MEPSHAPAGPNSASDRAPVAVVVPVKAFHLAKQRLADVLDADQRSRLARHLADGVATAVQRASDEVMAVDLLVACDDDEVRTWASERGATIVSTDGLDLNESVEAGIDAAIAGGAGHVVVAHADLARPATLLDVVRSGTIVLVPDRRRDGTNVMAFPAPCRVVADYGTGSFRRHLTAATLVAEMHEATIRVLASPELALDVDTTTDLLHPATRKGLPSWLRTHQANPSTPRG
ncbi:MAG: hypothetical protein AAGG08_05545 [Actinomycetota bacterium]